MIANSSPPSRATVSPARVTTLSRWRDGHEQLVALGVAQPVVDGLEVVEVQEQDGRRAASAAGAGQGVTQPVQEQEAVLEAGQDVVERLVAELLLEGLALRDVAVVDDHAADGGIVEEVLGDRLERPPRVVGVAGPELRPGLRATHGRDVGQPAFHGSRDRRDGCRRRSAGRPAPRHDGRGSARRPGSRSGSGRPRRARRHRPMRSGRATGSAPPCAACRRAGVVRSWPAPGGGGSDRRGPAMRRRTRAR